MTVPTVIRTGEAYKNKRAGSCPRIPSVCARSPCRPCTGSLLVIVCTVRVLVGAATQAHTRRISITSWVLHRVPKHDSLSLLSLFSHRARRHAEVARGIAVGWARVAAVRVPSAS